MILFQSDISLGFDVVISQQLNIGLGNGLVSWSDKPLLEPLMICIIMHYQASMSPLNDIAISSWYLLIVIEYSFLSAYVATQTSIDKLHYTFCW